MTLVYKPALLLMVSMLAVMASTSADAQAPAPETLRNDRDRALDPPEVAPPPPRFALPPVEQLTPRPGALQNQVSFTVRAIEVRGAGALSPTEIAALTDPYVNRAITLFDVQTLTQAITEAYVRRGFVNSGARAPDQDVSSGQLIIEVVEGKLSDIRVTGANALSEEYVARRMRDKLGQPLDFGQLQRNFQLLSEDPNIAEIDAQLRPADELGLAALDVTIREPKAWSVAVTLASDRSPAIGGDRLGVEGVRTSAFISGDRLTAGVGGGESFKDASFAYSAPINARDWRVSINVDAAESEIVEAPFNALDIQSDGETYRVDLTAPLWRRFGERVSVGAGVERRVSRTELLGAPFSFTPEARNGETEITFGRLTQDVLKRGRRQAFAAQANLLFGLDAPEARTPGLEAPDENFVILTAQARYLRRIGLDHQINVAFDGQAAEGPQYASMRYSIGGIGSVRGYRRNAAAGDQALRVSLEWQSRLPRRAFGVDLPALQSRLFFDAAQVWTAQNAALPVDAIAGAGIELEWAVSEQISLTAFAAAPLGDDLKPADKSIQDEGFGYRLVTRF